MCEFPEGSSPGSSNDPAYHQKCGMLTQLVFFFFLIAFFFKLLLFWVFKLGIAVLPSFMTFMSLLIN